MRGFMRRCHIILTEGTILQLLKNYEQLRKEEFPGRITIGLETKCLLLLNLPSIVGASIHESQLGN
jgi:hypothetical protein